MDFADGRSPDRCGVRAKHQVKPLRHTLKTLRHAAVSVGLGPSLRFDLWAEVSVGLGPSLRFDLWAEVSAGLGPSLRFDLWAEVHKFFAASRPFCSLVQ
jgi:hypothetical protein